MGKELEIQQLIEQVLQLSLDDRIVVLQKLALSLKQPSEPKKYRTPPPELAGKGIEHGDIIHDSVPLEDWNLP
jgi:hypothetical protein